MDLHPIIVHFPIALLTVYCALELFRFKFLTRHPSWFHMKAVFVILGALPLPFALATGDEASHVIRDASNRALIQAHENIATMTTWVFVLIALAYLLLLLEKDWSAFSKSVLGQKLLPIAHLFERTGVIVPLAFVAFALLALTGMLGGAIAYGPDADPLARPVLGFLGLV